MQTIQQGSSGPDVVTWQKIVGVEPDGQFGPATASATRTWQAAHGVAADGVVGPLTWAAAQSSSPALSKAGLLSNPWAVAGVVLGVGFVLWAFRKDG